MSLKAVGQLFGKSKERSGKTNVKEYFPKFDGFIIIGFKPFVITLSGLSFNRSIYYRLT